MSRLADTPKSWLPPLLVVLLVPLLVTASGCGREQRADAAALPLTPAVAVRAAEVSLAQAEEPLRFAGLVRPRQRAVLTFQVGGVLRERPLEIGQQVKAGQLLARLYNPELEPARDAARARLQELQAQAEQARRDVDRAEQLYQRGVMSAQEREQQAARRDALLASVNSARAALRQSEQLQGEMRLLAPFDASIEALLVEPGEYVAPGQPVLRLSASVGHEVEVRVPAALLHGIELGQSLPVWASVREGQWLGRVSEIGQSASQGSVLYPLVLSLDEPGLQAGDAVEVGLARQQPGQLSVPLAAIMRSAEGLSVFRIEGERVSRVAVEVRGMQGERALLETGSLQPGEQVVYAGLTRLADQDRVELLP